MKRMLLGVVLMLLGIAYIVVLVERFGSREVEEHPITTAYRLECYNVGSQAPFSLQTSICRDFQTHKCYLVFRGVASLSSHETDCIVLEGEYSYWMNKAIEKRVKRRVD